MKRIHLFEIEDAKWCPDWMRQCLTNYLATLHKIMGSADVIEPLVARCLEHSQNKTIVDLCSGAGGPMLTVFNRLRQRPGLESIRLIFTDLYPNKSFADTINAKNDPAIRYELSPVDAGDVKEKWSGLRTLICSMHHMRPAVARKILADAFHKRQPLLVFEISDNSAPKFLWWTAVPLGFLLVLVLTLAVRPLSFRHLFFTYVIPILPLFISWDGAVSNVRTYTQEDMAELLQGLESDEYTWEKGVIRKKGVPGGMLYLMGLPKV